MNVYGLVGHTEGHSISQIAVGLKGPNGKVVPLPGMQDLDFRLDFKVLPTGWAPPGGRRRQLVYRAGRQLHANAL